MRSIGRPLRFVGTDSSQIIPLDVGTLARTFELLDDLHAAFPDLEKIELPFELLTIVRALSGIEGMEFYENLGEVIECVNFLRPKDPSYILQFRCYTSADLSPLKLACSQLDLDSDPSIYSIIAVIENRPNGDALAWELIKGDHPVALFLFLFAFIQRRPLRMRENVLRITKLLRKSDLCDLSEVSMKDSDVRQLRDSLRRLVIRGAELGKAAFQHIIAAMDIRHASLQNQDSSIPLLFELRGSEAEEAVRSYGHLHVLGESQREVVLSSLDE